MHLKKVKWNGDEVHIEWHQDVEGGTLEHALTSKDDPAPDFKRAFRALDGPVGELVGLELEIVGLSIKEESQGGRGYVFTFQVALDAFKAPMTANTPYIRERREGDAEDAQVLPKPLDRAVVKLEARARDYAEGQRSQVSLFEGSPVEEEAGELVEGSTV